MAEVVDVRINTTMDGADRAAQQIDGLTQKVQGLGTSVGATDLQMKSADTSIGKFSENATKSAGAVKNLHENFNKLGEAGKGLSGIMVVLGKLFGVDVETIKTLTEVHGSLREAMRATGDITRATSVETEKSIALKQAATAATEEQIVAEEGLAVAAEETGEAMAISLGPIGLVIAGVAALAVGVYEYVEAKKNAKIIEEAHKESLKEEIKLDKDLYDIENKLAVLEGEKGKKEEDRDKTQKEAYDSKIAAAQEFNKAMKALGESPTEPTKPEMSTTPSGLRQRGAPSPESAYQSAMMVYNAQLAAFNEYQEKKRKIQEDYDNINATADQLAADATVVLEVETDHELEKLRVEDFYKIKLAKDASLKDDRERKLKELEDKKNEELALLALDSKYNKDNVAMNQEKSNTIVEIYKIERQRILDEQDKTEEEELKRYEKWLNEFLKKHEEWLKKKKEQFDKATKNEADVVEAIQKNEIDETIEALQIKGKLAAAEDEKYYKKTLETRKYYDDLLAKATNPFMRATLMQQMYQQQENDYNQHEKNLTEINKKANEKRIKQDVETVKEIVDAAIQGAEEANEAEQKATDFRLQQQSQAIDVQKALAQKGLDNDLAFEQKKQAELQKQKLQEIKKEKQLKELETFLNAVAKFADQDPKTAVPKALGLLAATKAVEATFSQAGGIIGMNDQKSMVSTLGMSRKHTSGNDVLLHAERGEAVLTVEEVNALGGPKGFYNLRELLKKPNTAVMPNIISTNNNEDVVNELREIKNSFKNLKQENVDWRSHTEMVISTVENGMKDVVKYISKKPRI